MFDFDIKDKSLASKGVLKIAWAEKSMPVLRLIRKRFEHQKPLKNVRIGACLHVTSETANLILTLKSGGAIISLCASNPLSTQDDVAAALVSEYKIPVFAIKGEDNRTYYRHLKHVILTRPNVTMDDGADLITLLHKYPVKKSKGKVIIQDKNGQEWEFFGSSEETTTGVIRLKAMEKDKILKVPVLAVNDSYTKYLFDNRYGTGQSTIDGIMRATNLLLAGKSFVICGYGWCGRGLALRAKGMGAYVIICEVDPIKALEAIMDGFQVMPIKKAAKVGNIFVTTTGNKNVITTSHIQQMKDGAILANAGHFNVEIDVEGLEKIAISKKKIRDYVDQYAIVITKKGQEIKKVSNPIYKKVYLLGEGRLINLVAAEGHPPEVMDLSFSNQALACEWFVKNKGKLETKVYRLSQRLDKMVAGLKLQAMGVKVDRLTLEQKKYLTSWREGT